MASAVNPPVLPVSFELQNTSLFLASLVLKTTDWKALAVDLARQFGPLGESPEFFDHDALEVDLSQLSDVEAIQDLAALDHLLRRFKLMPVALRGGSPHLLKQARQLGWAASTQSTPAHHAAKRKPVAPTVQVKETIREVFKEIRVDVPGAAKPAMVLEKPLRSGQKIYAKDCDLVVLSMVNPGAELMADGNIHVYASLRGRAMAGVNGNADARIFALSMDPELVAIAGIYRTSENPLPVAVRSKPAQVRLLSSADRDQLLIEPLKA